MIDHIQFFQKGAIYRIRNRKTKRYLCLHSKLQLKTEDEQQTCDQLWIVNEIKNGEYEIGQFKVGSVLTLQQSKGGFLLQLSKNKLLDKQLWMIVFGEAIQGINYFWIKPSLNINLSLSASSIDQSVKISGIDMTLNICLWQFVVYENVGKVLDGLSLIKSESSRLMLTLPQYSSKQGIGIIQYLLIGGGNQRWIIQSYKDLRQGVTKEYTIRNYCSGLYLTAVFTKLAFKVIQSIYNCSADQRWLLIKIGDNTFLIQCVSNNAYYLGITNDKGGSQVNIIQDRLKSRWIIQGGFMGMN